MTVIPVLVAGARMPEPDGLPPELRPLTRRNAIELSDPRWRYDFGRLNTTLDELLAELSGTEPMDVPGRESSDRVKPAGAATAARAPAAGPTRRRLVAGIVALAVAGGLAALGVVVLGGGSDGGDGGSGGGGGGSAVVGSEGIQFEPFTQAKSFTVDMPMGWHKVTLEENLTGPVERTQLESPNGKLNLHILQEPESPPEDRANGIERGQRGAGVHIHKPRGTHVRDPRNGALRLRDGWEGLGPGSVVSYAFNAGGFGGEPGCPCRKKATAPRWPTRSPPRRPRPLKPR